MAAVRFTKAEVVSS